MNSNLDELKRRLKELARQKLQGRDLRHTLTADIEVPLSDLRPGLLNQLESLQPTGYGNPEAVFVSRNVRVTNVRTVGAENRHLKLALTDGTVTFDAIGFRLGHLKADMPLRVDIVYTFEINEFNGRTSLQLNLKDVHPSESS
jgi:single-stranded-DNA-specific exonuclease